MATGVVDVDLAIHVHRQSPGVGKDRIAHIVLRTAGAGHPQFGGPPAVTWIGDEQRCSCRRGPLLRRCVCSRPCDGRWRDAALLLPAAAALLLHAPAQRRARQRLRCQHRRDIPAKAVDASLEPIVEHIADHHHPTGHPLAGPSQFRMVELHHATTTAQHRLHQLHHRAAAETMAMSKVLGDPQALLSDLFHVAVLLSLPLWVGRCSVFHHPMQRRTLRQRRWPSAAAGRHGSLPASNPRALAATPPLMPTTRCCLTVLSHSPGHSGRSSRWGHCWGLRPPKAMWPLRPS